MNEFWSLPHTDASKTEARRFAFIAVGAGVWAVTGIRVFFAGGTTALCTTAIVPVAAWETQIAVAVTYAAVAFGAGTIRRRAISERPLFFAVLAREIVDPQRDDDGDDDEKKDVLIHDLQTPHIYFCRHSLSTCTTSAILSATSSATVASTIRRRLEEFFDGYAESIKIKLYYRDKAGRRLLTTPLTMKYYMFIGGSIHQRKQHAANLACARGNDHFANWGAFHSGNRTILALGYPAGKYTYSSFVNCSMMNIFQVDPDAIVWSAFYNYRRGIRANGSWVD